MTRNEENLRFSFGANWKRYLSTVTEQEVTVARESLINLLGEEDRFNQASFIDIGCGSGLFSYCAHQLGCREIVSIDLDPESVTATRRLAVAWCGSVPEHWSISETDILDTEKLKPYRGRFDIVYAWGSLHHTGAMYRALSNALSLGTDQCMAVIAIYARTKTSSVWYHIKRMYNSAPSFLRPVLALPYTMIWGLGRLLKGRHPWKRKRGMNIWHDTLDWFGGWPYEFAGPDEIISFVEKHGFSIKKMNITTRNGCNEYVLTRTQDGA
ncbi:MAG: class I SAM-dependent methyltransferase [bacterium]|nr:class I SAM-dependent methyltransferase [bacterium]